MSSATTIARRLPAAALLLVAVQAAAPARAQDPAAAERTYQEIERALGGVPTFMKLYPKSAVAGAWAQFRDLELSDKTALPPKMKALISLAVAAQIPCAYCVWADTRTAKARGASDEEIAEAVAVASLTRHWSAFFHGMQIDFATFRKEFGDDAK